MSAELWESDERIAGPVLSTAVAFRLFMLLVPLLLIMVAVVGFLHVSGSTDAVADHLGFSQILVDTFDRVGDDAASSRWIILWVGVVAMAVAIRSIAMTLEVVHRNAWGTGAVTRMSRTIDYMTALGVALVIVAYVVGAQWVRVHVSGGGVFASFIIGIGTVLAYLAIMEILPTARGAGWRDLLPGALLIGAGTQLLHYLTVFHFADKVGRASATFGPLGIAVAALAWLYLIGRLMVLAPILNATIWRARHPDDPVVDGIDTDGTEIDDERPTGG